MSSHPSLRHLYNFSGWVIHEMQVAQDLVVIKLYRDKRHRIYCPHCIRKAGLNRKVMQTAYDLPVGPANLVIVQYEALQGYCSHCKSHFTIHPQEIDRYAHATTRLMHYVCRLCRFMPADKIPVFLPISASTARRWDKRILAKHLPNPDLDNLRILLIDEKSIGAHHHYMTVVINGETGEVLHLAEGKKKTSLESFFHQLTQKQIKKIKAVGIDRAGAYKAVIEEYAPKAQIVFDKFHIVSNLNAAVDEVRRSEWRNAAKEDKKFIKGQRFNLLRNAQNLKDEQCDSLARLFEANEALFQAYLLKDAFTTLWTYVRPKWASKFLDNWIDWAKETGLKSLVRFAKGVDRDRNEILAWIKHRITSAKLESFNATINRIVKRACGYRDLDYLYLKIRQEAAPPVLQL
jgi:transposase